MNCILMLSKIKILFKKGEIKNGIFLIVNSCLELFGVFCFCENSVVLKFMLGCCFKDCILIILFMYFYFVLCKLLCGNDWNKLKYVMISFYDWGMMLDRNIVSNIKYR